MKTILVLGGAGFIGGHLARKMKSEGNWVRVVDIKAHHDFMKESLFCDDYVVGDLRDLSVVNKIVKCPNGKYFDEIYQFASDSGGIEHTHTGSYDADIITSSVLINLNLLMSVKRNFFGKIFYSSSSSVYPSNSVECKEHEAYPANPDSEYAWEKLFSERLYLSYHKNYQIDVRIARLHTVYGPHSPWTGGREKVPAAICRKVITALFGEHIEVWGNGQQKRSFLYIDDCLLAIQNLMTQTTCVTPVNIGSETPISINELAEKIIEVSGKQVIIKNLQGEEFKSKYGFDCPVGVFERYSNNNLYEKHTNKKINSSFHEGIKKTYDWIYFQINGGLV